MICSHYQRQNMSTPPPIFFTNLNEVLIALCNKLFKTQYTWTHSTQDNDTHWIKHDSKTCLANRKHTHEHPGFSWIRANSKRVYFQCPEHGKRSITGKDSNKIRQALGFIPGKDDRKDFEKLIDRPTQTLLCGFTITTRKP